MTSFVCLLVIVLLQNGIKTLVTVSHCYHYHCLPVANCFFKPVPHIIQHIAGPCDVIIDINVNDRPKLLISGDNWSHAIFKVMRGIGFLRVNKMQRHRTKVCARFSQNIIIMFMETNKSNYKQKTYTIRNQVLFCLTGFNKTYFENSLNH